jgi:hypothetical protein
MVESGDSLSIEAIPQRSTRIMSFVLPTVLVVFGLFLFERSNWTTHPLFIIVWLGVAGAFFLNGLLFERIVFSHRGRVVIRRSSVLGILPVWKNTYDFDEFTNVQWTIGRAYDRGKYVPSIILIKRDKGEMLLQQYPEIDTKEHALSLEVAEAIARFSGLQLLRVAESW